MQEKTIGIIGAGVIGTGVAQSFLCNGFKVKLLDINNDILQKSKQKIITEMRYYDHIYGLQTSFDEKSVLQRIIFSTDYYVLSDVDFIIENVTESIHIKNEVYLNINNIINSRQILGINTSAISINKIASLLQYPQNVIGIHFMNPVPLMKTVEVIVGDNTSQKTIDGVRHMLESIDKRYIIIKDGPGFVTNRLLMIFINEASALLQEGIATVEKIDILCKECFGHNMGPFQTADLIGLDTVVCSLNVMYDSFGDEKYAPCQLLKDMVKLGEIGIKSGKGFYYYG